MFVRFRHLGPRTVSTATRGTRRLLSTGGQKLKAPPMVYIKGEEMTRYTMDLILDQWIHPFVDTSNWEYFDLSCKARDDTEDQCLQDAVSAGARIKAIFKEPTITPTEVQREKLGLKKAWGSPNGAMRRGWNGITISRDTIHIKGMQLGFKRPVLFERHAVGGEYGAGWSPVGKGKVMTTFFPDDDSQPPSIVDSRSLKDDSSVVVVYDNPLDNVEDLAHIFFKRCLEAKVVPYVVTKKTVFKWQEGFWLVLKAVFDKDYKDAYTKAGLLEGCGGELQHLISDAATMQIIRWTSGGFGMACHNYDGDMLTDEVAQVHRSPGFITSNLIGKAEDGTLIKEFEASHGTVADLYEQMLRGEETSMNPLGMVEALIGAMQHAATLNPESCDAEGIHALTDNIRQHMHTAMVNEEGTRDLCGPEGLTTEQFVENIADRISGASTRRHAKEKKAILEARALQELSRKHRRNYDVDMEKVQDMFNEYDTKKNGRIDLDEFTAMVVKLGIAPQAQQRSSAKDDPDN
jgi:isocitrate dehydrogenase